MLRWWIEGHVTPHVCARVPLAEANKAFEMVQSRVSTGKVVITM